MFKEQMAAAKISKIRYREDEVEKHADSQRRSHQGSKIRKRFAKRGLSRSEKNPRRQSIVSKATLVLADPQLPGCIERT
jgi:hypothetical protein